VYLPHFHLEYSANLEATVDIGALCEAIRDTAASIDIFPLVGIRVRATRVDHYAIADGNAKHGFIDLSIRLREGRSETAKKDAVEKIFDCLRAFMEPVLATSSVALSAEIRDIAAEMAPKYGTIRQHLKGIE